MNVGASAVVVAIAVGAWWRWRRGRPRTEVDDEEEEEDADDEPIIALDEAALVDLVRRCEYYPRLTEGDPFFVRRGNVVEYEWDGPYYGGLARLLTNDRAEKVLTFIENKSCILWLQPGQHYMCTVDRSRDVVGSDALFCSCMYADRPEGVKFALSGIGLDLGSLVMLNILGKDRRIRRYELSMTRGSITFPFTPEGLQAFLEEIQRGPRPKHWNSIRGAPPCEACCSSTTVSFRGRLTEAQMRVVACGGHRGLHVEVDGSWRFNDGLKWLSKGIQRNLCPAQLTFDSSFSNFHLMALDEAIGLSTSLEALHFDRPSWEVMRLMSKNKRLRSLHFREGNPGTDFPRHERTFWKAVASHPTLQVLELGIMLPSWKLEAMAQILPSSTSLQYLCAYVLSFPFPSTVIRDFVRGQVSQSHAPASPLPLRSASDDWLEQSPDLRDYVLPALVMNRFRPLVSAMINAPDPAARFREVWSALVDDETVRSTPSLSFHLLTSAPDIFVEGLSRRSRSSAAVE